MKRAFIFLVIIFLINIPSVYYGWYMELWWIDIVFHFLGGFFVAIFMADYLKNHLIKREPIKNALIIAGATVFIGVVWEFSEYIGNQTLIEPFYRWFKIRVYFMGDLKDTVADLLLDILGAISFTVLHFLWRRNSHQGQTLT